MSNDLLLLERPAPGLVQITLNRPQQRNALSAALRGRLVAALDGVAADATVQVVVLTGAGPAFCAGLDLSELAAPGAAGALSSRSGLDVVAALARIPGVIIGAVNGPAVTGGLEVALACDMLIAADTARFADTHGRVGVMPGWGLSQRLPRIVGVARAKQMSLTGDYLDADQALAWGLVNEVVPAADLLPRALTLARQMMELPPDLLRRYKRLVDSGMQVSLEQGLVLEARNAVDWQSGFDPAAFASRRAAIEQRGREQVK